jgi:hypothetical protein
MLTDMDEATTNCAEDVVVDRVEQLHHGKSPTDHLLSVRDLERWIGSFDPRDPGVCRVKRFFELWLADPVFRAALLVDPCRATAERALDTPAAELRYLWDDAYRADLEREDISDMFRHLSNPTRRLFGWIRANHHYRDQMRNESRPQDLRFAAWRNRQVARVLRRRFDEPTTTILPTSSLQ